MSIKRLPESVISRIAAGEVITSPYNIIKELLENSLDACSSSVTINISSSLRNLSIRDNGTGIEKEDLEFLCLNHYTSKIQSIEDLKKHGSIASNSSFGFRGEALHSISLCSHVKIQTKTSQRSSNDTGYLAIYSNDRLVDIKECAFDGHGTFIEIKDIFYNNTIRSEHFSKNKTELLSCIGLAACYGTIYNSIECKVDDKVVLGRDIRGREMTCDVDGTIENRKSYILKNILNSKSFSCKDENLKSFYKFMGGKSSCVGERFLIICSEPNTSFKASKFVFFVNKRLVKNDALKNKILQKYRSMKKGCNPFVFIEMFLDNVDVNIHPSKAEVLVDKESIFPEILQAFDRSFASSLEINESTRNLRTDPDIPEDGSECSIYNSNDSMLGITAPALGNSVNSKMASFDSSIINESALHKATQSSPLKVYSSPFVRRLDEHSSQCTQAYRKFSLLSLKSLLSEFKEIDRSFFKSLVFVGVFEGSIFVQHHTNLIRINKEPFLFNVFYQKILKEFGNFECIELNRTIETGIEESLWELLREYFGVHIENKQIIAVPKVYGIVPETECNADGANDGSITEHFRTLIVEKTDEVGTIRNIAQGIAKIYAKATIDVKLFNKIKTEAIATMEIADTLCLMSDLKDLYKTFDRC